MTSSREARQNLSAHKFARDVDLETWLTIASPHKPKVSIFILIAPVSGTIPARTAKRLLPLVYCTISFDVALEDPPRAPSAASIDRDFSLLMDWKPALGTNNLCRAKL